MGKINEQEKQARLDKKELDRHNKILNQINSAKQKSELPNITFSTIASYLASNITYNGKRLSSNEFKPIVKAINDYGLCSLGAYEYSIEYLSKVFETESEQEALRLFNQVATSKRFQNLLSEIDSIAIKMNEIKMQEDLKNHKEVLDDIISANSMDELPKIGISALKKIILKSVNSQDFYITFKSYDIDDLVDTLLTGGDIGEAVDELCSDVVLPKDQLNLMKDQIIGSILENKRVIDYLIEEINGYKIKYNYLKDVEEEDNHNKNIEQMERSDVLSELPKVSINDLTNEVLKAVNDNDFYVAFTAKDVKELVNGYLDNVEDVRHFVRNLVSKYMAIMICNTSVWLPDRTYNDYVDIMWKSLMHSDQKLRYMAEEVVLKEVRKLEIYEQDYKDTMEQIKSADQLYKLPNNIHSSTLYTYLANNSALIPSLDSRIESAAFKKLANMLMTGAKWEDEEVKQEVKKITDDYYPRRNAYLDLYNKLKDLPKTYYYASLVRAYENKRTQLIINSNTFVNIYYILNLKNKNGGRFFDCYANQGEYYDLNEIYDKFKTDYVSQYKNESEIPELPKNALLNYLRENYDPTFKKIGGIILALGEKFRNICIFIPEEGQVLVDYEQKVKMDNLSDLDTKISDNNKELSTQDYQIEENNRILDYQAASIEYNEALLKELNDKINEAKLLLEDMNVKVDAGARNLSSLKVRTSAYISDFENRAVQLCQDIKDGIKDIKFDFDYSSDDNQQDTGIAKTKK